MSAEESQLLLKINQGLPPDVWQRYHILVEKRHAETLSQEEYQELLALTDQIELANVERISYVAELARLRQVSLEDVMAQLGIRQLSDERYEM